MGSELSKPNPSVMPESFVCIYAFGRKKRLVRVQHRGEYGWYMARWSSAGYWSSNGGGAISQAMASLLFNDGEDVMVLRKA